MICTLSKIIPENHISYHVQDKIKSWIEPLNSKFGINYFNFTVSYPNNKKGFTLHTNADFYESWFTQELPMCQFSHKSGWYFWESCSSENLMKSAQNLGIGKGILHLQHLNGMTITSAFAMRPDAIKSEEFLMNNLNLLKGFTNYFTEEAKEIIAQAKKELITYLPGMIAPAPDASLQNMASDPHMWAFGPLQLLSNRERQCYFLLLRGHSMLEISEKLELSPSSVNMYIARLKQKLNCASKNDLLELADRYGIISYHPSLPFTEVTMPEWAA